MLDLESVLDPWRVAGYRPPQPPRSVPLEPFTQEEEKSILGQVANAGLGGIAYVGSAMEKALGGRAIRGLLGGKPREALTIIPFSDTLGITDYQDRVSGRDLLRQWGAADKEDTWGNFAAGLGLELATDPATFLSPFGLTKAGQAATKAGIPTGSLYGRVGNTLRGQIDAIPDVARRAKALVDAENAAGGAAKLAGLMDQPLGSVVNFKIPFVGEAVPIGTGKGGQAFLDAAAAPVRGLNAAHEWAKAVPYGGGWAYQALAGWPIDLAKKAADVGSRYGQALFSAPVMGTLNRESQAVAPQRFYQGFTDAADWTGLGQQLGKRLEDIGVVEARPFLDVLEGRFPGPLAPDTLDAMRGVADDLQSVLKARIPEAERLGMRLSDWFDPLAPGVQFGPRRVLPMAEAGARESGLPFRGADSAVQGARKEFLQGFSKGSSGVEDAMNDLAVYTLPRDQAAAHVVQKYLAPLDPAQYPGTANMTAQQHFAEAVQQQVARAGDFVDAARARGDRAAMVKAGQWVPYWQHPVQSFIDYGQRYSQMKAGGEAALDLMAQNLGATGVPVAQALKRAGLTAQDQAGNLTALEEIARRMGGGATAQTVAGLSLPEHLADDLSRVARFYDAPQAAQGVMNGFDYLTDLFKRGVTSPFPAFHVRNLMGGTFTNVSRAGAGVLGDVGSAEAMLAGRPIKGASSIPGMQGLTDAEATQRLAQTLQAYGVLGGRQGQHAETLAQAAAMAPTSLTDMLNLAPGAVPKTTMDVGRDIVAALRGQGDATWNPKTLLPGGDIDKWAPVAYGQVLGGRVEAMSRIPLFVNLKRQGYSDAQAALETLRAHGDYTGRLLTPTEKTWMRRLVPFWTYARFNTPHQLSMLASQPGGLAATYAKAAQGLRDDQFLPPYLGSGLAAPLTDEDPATGMRRYLTRLDTPVEQLGELVAPGGLTEKGLNLLSQLNPMLKGPLEVMTGRQFFTGRDLQDLTTFTGSQPLDQLVMNSPLARVMTTARTLTDPRKWDPYAIPLNLLTGAKVSDVDVPKYRTIAEREYVEDQLRGLPNVGKFESLVIRPEALATMTPEEVQMVRLQRTLESRARKEAAARKKVRINP